MFINIPDNYSSLMEDLIYEFRSTSKQDFVVEVFDTVHDKIVGVKKFYSETQISINIAPILRHIAMHNVEVRESGFYTPDDGYIRVVVRCNDTESEERIFMLAREPIYTTPLISTMPKKRLISYSESDTLRFIVDSSAEVSARLEASYSGDSGFESCVYSAPENTGLVCFTVTPADFSDHINSIKVELLADGDVIEFVEYYIISEQLEDCRLAWISSKGSIEHYTFPIVKELKVLRNGDLEYELRSAYGTCKEMEALSEVVYSPRVWCIGKDGYKRIEVTNDYLSVKREGTLQLVDIKIIEKSGCSCY